MDKSVKITMKCIFCKSSKFDVPYENYEPKSGEQIRCANCGRTNDYDSLLKLAKNEGLEIAKDFAENEVKKMLKRAFK